ncbi:unnamed protein product [Victoria cruziana]
MITLPSLFAALCDSSDCLNQSTIWFCATKKVERWRTRNPVIPLQRLPPALCSFDSDGGRLVRLFSV